MRAELRDWDLWGPLFLCMSLAVMLSIKAHDDASIVFSVIFVIVWVGAAVITVNGQLLGGKLYVFFASLHSIRSFWRIFLNILTRSLQITDPFSRAFAFWGIVSSQFFSVLLRVGSSILLSQ